MDTNVQVYDEPLILDSTLKSRIRLEYLTEKFKSCVRNSITPKRLAWLSNFAETIQTPTTYGTFENKMSYINTLKLLHLSTQETRHRKYFLLNCIIPRLVLKNKSLDAGCGSGDLARLLGRYFSELTLVDIDDLALNNVTTFSLESSCCITKLHSDLLTVGLPFRDYDLIVLSHVLYYIAPEDWFVCVDKLARALSSNGILIIIVSTDLDKTDIAKKFGGQPISLSNVIFRCMHELDVDLEMFVSKESFLAKDMKTMSHIANMCLHDVKAKSNEVDIFNYLQRLFCKKTELYKLDLYQQFLVITKKSNNIAS